MRLLIAGVLLLAGGAAAAVERFDFAPYVTQWAGAGMSATGDVAVGDVNGDRLDDIVVGTGFAVGGSPYDYSLQVFLQQADGTLAPPVNYPYGNHYGGQIRVALADLNSDGVADIVA